MTVLVKNIEFIVGVMAPDRNARVQHIHILFAAETRALRRAVRVVHGVPVRGSERDKLFASYDEVSERLERDLLYSLPSDLRRHHRVCDSDFIIIFTDCREVKAHFVRYDTYRSSADECGINIADERVKSVRCV